MRHPSRIAALAVVVAVAGPASAQNLADRVASASQPRVQFSFAARAEVCGNGRSFIQAGGSWYGNFGGDFDRREQCADGPVRVVIDRAGREVISISSYAGPLPETPQGITDLGRVGTRAATDYLLGLAERSEGRVSRDAILPAVLADSVDVGPRLLAIATNQDAARQTRSSAISWLGRPLDSRERSVQNIAASLLRIAKDEDDNQNVRQQALRTLARLEHGAGTTALMELARDAQRSWLAREAVSAINSAGDPRARQFLRDIVRRAEMPDDVLARAVQTLGGEYATGDDVKLIRDSYARLPGDRSRDAALSSIAQFGGTENVRWMLSLARNADAPIATRRKAVQHAYRGGTAVADIVKIYDETTDTQLKDAVMSALVESGEKQATDKLMQIARSDPSTQMRRKAISHLGRSNDERVKQFLAELADRLR